jgi:hypothetical protein
MPGLTLPPDLAEETLFALRSYPDDPAVQRFSRLIQRGTPWSVHWPRVMLRWATRHAIAVRDTRLISVLLVGFSGAARWRSVPEAIAILHRARRAVAAGREPRLIYADGHDLLVMDGAPLHRSRWWGDEALDAPPLSTSHHASPAMPPLTPPAPNAASSRPVAQFVAPQPTYLRCDQ